MQRPTCVNLRIRNANDANRSVYFGLQLHFTSPKPITLLVRNRVLHAVRNGILPMVKRRLDDQERLSLRSGCVYVWEERSNNPLEVTGQEIQRFTEGTSNTIQKFVHHADRRCRSLLGPEQS